MSAPGLTLRVYTAGAEVGTAGSLTLVTTGVGSPGSTRSGPAPRIQGHGVCREGVLLP